MVRFLGPTPHNMRSCDRGLLEQQCSVHGSCARSPRAWRGGRTILHDRQSCAPRVALAFGLGAVVRTALYLTSSSSRKAATLGPPTGRRVDHAATRDYSNSCLRPVPALMVLMSLSCKVAALGLDRWGRGLRGGRNSVFSTHISVSVLYGLLPPSCGSQCRGLPSQRQLLVCTRLSCRQAR